MATGYQGSVGSPFPLRQAERGRPGSSGQTQGPPGIRAVRVPVGPYGPSGKQCMSAVTFQLLRLA